MTWNGFARINLNVRSQQRCELIDITEQLKRHVARQGVDDGMLIVYSPHTTAGITINENADPDVKRDLLAKLEREIPKQEDFYRHGEGNSDSHLKTVLTGTSVTVLVENGQLVLGRWQGVYFAEFDGPREREVFVKLVGHVRGA